MGSSLVTGIDINSHSIKAVVLKPVGELYALVGYKELLISDDIFTDNHTLEYQKTVKKLKELKKGLPFGSRNVSISVPDNTVISKMLQIESELEDREKEFSIYQTFAHQSPFPVEELSLDFIKLEDKSFAKGSTTSYQIYATRKEVVESRSKALTKAGFKPLVVDIQAHGLLNIWQLASQLNPDKKNWLLVDVGFEQTALGTIPEGGATFFKDIAFGMKDLANQSPANNFSANHDLDELGVTATASTALSAVNPPFDPQVAGLLGGAKETQAFTYALNDKIKRQLQLYSSVNSTQPLAGIWLMGEGSNTPMLAETLEKQFQIPCEVLNPLSLFENKVPKKRRGALDWQSFGIAAGMAVSGLKWQGGKHAASS